MDLKTLNLFMNATSDLHFEVYIGLDCQDSWNSDSVLVFVVVASSPNSIIITQLFVFYRNTYCFSFGSFYKELFATIELSDDQVCQIFKGSAVQLFYQKIILVYLASVDD